MRPGTFPDSLLKSQMIPAIGLGGPVVRDQAFYYGSARYVRETKWDRFNKVGMPLPDEVRTGPELFGKLSPVGRPPASPHGQLSSPARSRRECRPSPR